MPEKKSEYYIIERANNSLFPLLIEDDGCPFYIKQKDRIENPERMFFCLGAPIPRKPEMVDYHPVPYTVVSRKIYNILQSMNINGTQLIPATITGKENELYEDYFYLHIYNIYEILDKELSVFSKWNKILKEAMGLSKIVFDKKELDDIPLEKRLIFKLKEKKTIEFYHQSIVDKVMESNPRGIRFINVDDWNEGSVFN